MYSSLGPVSKAIFTRLSEYSARPSGLTITDYVAAGTVKPYLTVGSPTENESNTFGGAGFENYTIITIYSDYKGNKQLTEIHEWVMEALKSAPLTVEGASFPVTMRVESSQIIPLQEGLGRNLVMRIRIPHIR